MTLCSDRVGFRRQLDQIITAHVPRSVDHYAPYFHSRAEYYRYLNEIQDRSQLLSRDRWAYGSRDGLNRMVRGIARMAHRCWSCNRDISSWRPTGDAPRLQFHSLVNHLFGNYCCPPFLINAWLAKDSRTSRRDLNFFMKIVKGRSPRDAGLGLPLGKKLLGYFFQAPDDLSIDEGYRWAQVRWLDGSPDLARMLSKFLPAPLHPEFSLDEEFWIESVLFCIEVTSNPDKHGSVDHAELGKMMRFAFAMRNRPPCELLGYRLQDYRPLDPQFTLYKRTLKWVRRFMIHWREVMADEIARRLVPEKQVNLWTPSEIGPYVWADGNESWTITELLAARELAVDGHFMQHCVGDGDYVQRCKKRETSIWSLRRSHQRKTKRIVTIEVLPESRQIVAALGKCNTIPIPEALRVIKAWAQQERLEITE